VPSRRKGLYDDAPSAEQELRVEQNIQALLMPQRARVADLPVERIQPNPFQARRSFEDLDELADAIRAQGFITRLRVRPDPAAPERYQLIYGERRLRAAQLAGLATVPCEVVDVTDAALLEVGLAENIQRRDLNPLEEASAFHSFIAQRGYTQARLAERIGKPRSYVQERLALLDAPEDVQAMIRQRPDTLRVAREIARVPTAAARRPLIAAVLAGRLSKDDVSTLVRSGSEPAARPDDSDIPSRGAEIDEKQARFDRVLDRDIPALQVIFSRWRQALPQINDAQRERVLAYIERHLEELERLMDMLRK
jgi:ParB family chromosome partitioning protein